MDLPQISSIATAAATADVQVPRQARIPAIECLMGTAAQPLREWRHGAQGTVSRRHLNTKQGLAVPGAAAAPGSCEKARGRALAPRFVFCACICRLVPDSRCE